MSKCQGRNAQVCAGSSRGLSCSAKCSLLRPSWHAELSFLPVLGAPGSTCSPPALAAGHSLSYSFLGWTKVELISPFPSKEWPLITTRGQKITKTIKFRNPFMFRAFSLFFWDPYRKLLEIHVRSLFSEGGRSSALLSSPAISKGHVNICPHKPFLLAYNPKQNKFHGGHLMLQRPSRPELSSRHSFLWWWKCSVSVLSIMVASSYMWPLSTGKMWLVWLRDWIFTFI